MKKTTKKAPAKTTKPRKPAAEKPAPRPKIAKAKDIYI